MIIGQFTLTNEGNYTGSITAIGAILPRVSVEAVSAIGKSPDFVVTAAGVELGAAWNRASEWSGKAYVSVSLKSLFLSAPVYCALVEADQPGKYALVCNESKSKPAG